MRQASRQTIELNGRKIDYRLIPSKSARKLRVRVGPNGVEVVKPVVRNGPELETFLKANQNWITSQIERVERFSSLRKTVPKYKNEILYRGATIPVHVDAQPGRTNKIILENGTLTVIHGIESRTLPSRSLENWLRKQARQEICIQLETLTAELAKYPHKVYVMGQRTKWGNCSSLQNLSFNWRLIMAPDFVIHYFVTHETVHLEVPDHSNRFWLTVQSLCPDMGRARQWMRMNNDRLMIDLNQVC